MYQKIVVWAQQCNKNILIIGSPRSGTHALGSELAKLSGAINLKEICKVSDQPEPWHDINKLFNTEKMTIGQVVQLTPKIHLSKQVNAIKHHTVVVNIRRRNKIKQFASWVYFRVMDQTARYGWHNHLAQNTKVKQYSVVATESDLIQFMLEQLVDDYFLPDFQLCYEDLTFTQTDYFKNSFAFPIETMFSNLDFVEKFLKDWEYNIGHFANDKQQR